MTRLADLMSATEHTVAAPPLDVERVRRDFPTLRRTYRDRPLAYLDNAATSHKPNAVIDAIERFYRKTNSNVHRGVHRLSVEATDAYEQARATIARFLGAPGPDRIVFVRGATEAINLVAQSFLRPRIQIGDEILITHMEHHANIVPWQLLREQTGLSLRVAAINDRGELDLDDFNAKLTPRTRLVAITHASNALGTITPVADVIRRAHDQGVPVLVDGAQATPHLPVDVQALDADFYTFSGHKVFGPTGIGVLYGKAELLQQMPPYQGGGDMIRSVTFEKTDFADPPQRFEAGTPHIAGAIGLATAVDYLASIGFDALGNYEQRLLDHATHALDDIPGVTIVGTANDKVPVVSFTIDGVHPHDAGTILDQLGVAVRAGHHCTQPVMDRFGIPATVRASFALYNTGEEIAALARGVRKAIEVLG